MASMRVLQLAKEYGLSNKEMLEKVIELGIPAKSHASVLTEENVAKVREALGEASVDEKTGEPAERPLTKEEIEAREREAEEERARREAVEKERAAREAERAGRTGAAKSEKDESDWIAKQIATLTKKGCKNSDIAILFRAAFQSREIEQALLRKHIKYVVWGGIRFFERKEIKDALAYLRLVAYQDDLSFVRVINTPSRKFGKAKLARLQTLAKQEGTSLYATLKKHLRDKEFDKEAFAKFIELIEDCIKAKDNTKTSDMLEYLLQESGLKDLLREDEDEDRLENIQELASSILHYEKVNINEEISLDTYLQDIALYTNADYKDDGDTVKLMTIHQSKGLEFPIVFICGVTEGIFPNHRSIRERKKPALEEERRLMYVAITRAEKAVFLTESEGFDYTHKTSRCPSRFLMEIDRDIIKVDGDIPPEIWQGTFNLVRKLDAEIYMDGSMEEDEEEEDALKPGDKVTHKVLGEGTILDYDEERDSFKIDFNGSIRFIRSSFLTK